MPDIFDQAAGQTNGDIFDAAAQSATPAPKPQAKTGILDTAKQVVTSHAIQALGGPTATELYDKAFPPVEGPGVLRQASEFSRRIARFVPEAIDFTLAPMGAAATAVPVTRLIPPAAMPAIRAGVGAGFTADMAPGAVEATREAIQNPSGATIADALKADALTLAPLAHARGVAKKTRALDKSMEASKRQAEAFRVAEEQAARDEAAAEFAAREDTTPVPKGPKSAVESAQVFAQDFPPVAKSAAESAEVLKDVSPDAGIPRETSPAPKGAKQASESAKVFEESLPPEPLPEKSARESADIFDRALATREAQQAARQAKANVAVPETGVPEPVARTQDARERLAKELTGKPWSQVSNSEAEVIDGMIREGSGSAPAPQGPPQMRPAPAPALRSTHPAAKAPRPLAPRRTEPPLADVAPIEPPKPVAVPAARIARAPEPLEVRPEMPQSKGVGEFERFVGEEAKPEPVESPVKETAHVPSTLSGLRQMADRDSAIGDELRSLSERRSAVEDSINKATHKIGSAAVRAERRSGGLLGDGMSYRSLAPKTREQRLALEGELRQIDERSTELNNERRKLWEFKDVERYDFDNYLSQGKELPEGRMRNYADYATPVPPKPANGAAAPLPAPEAPSAPSVADNWYRQNVRGYDQYANNAKPEMQEALRAMKREAVERFTDAKKAVPEEVIAEFPDLKPAGEVNNAKAHSGSTENLERPTGNAGPVAPNGRGLPPQQSRADVASGGPDVALEKHPSFAPFREGMRQHLEHYQKRGVAAFGVGDTLYAPEGLYRLNENGGARLEHAFTKTGFETAMERNLDESAQYGSYNQAALERFHGLKEAERQRAESARAVEDANRKAAEEAQAKRNEFGKSLEAEVANAKFQKKSVVVKLHGDKTSEVQAHTIGGLGVYKALSADGNPMKGYSIVHAASGLGVMRVPTLKDAKMAAFRLSRLADFTQSAESLKKVAERLIGPVQAMNRDGVYAEFPAEKPVAPKKLNVPAARTRTSEVSAAKSRLKARAKELVTDESGEQRFELSTQDFQDLSTVGRDLLSRGAHRVEAWKQQMIDTFGDWVREHLDDVWDAVQRVQRAATPAVTRKGDSGPGFMVRRTGDVVDLADNARHYAMFNLDRELQSGAIRGRGNGIEYKSEEVDPTSLRIAVRRVADKYPEVYVDGPFGSRVYDSAELARNNYSLATTRGKSVAKPSSGERGSFSLKPLNQPTTPAEAYAKEMVAKREAARQGPVAAAWDRTKQAIRKLKAEGVDSTAPIIDLLSESQKKGNYEIRPSEDINHQIDRVYRAPSIGAQFAEREGLLKAIQSVDDLDYFEQYLIAKQARDVEAAGIKTGRKLDQDANMIREFEPRYREQEKMVREYSHKLLDYSVDSGLISKDLATKLKEIYPNYVPINRVFKAIEIGDAKGVPGARSVASLSKQTVVQKLVGSEREIENPLASFMDKTQAAFMQGERNKAAGMLAGYRDLPGFKGLITEVTAEGRSVPEHLSFPYLDAGKRRVFETTPEIAAAAKALDRKQLGVIGQVIAAPGRLFKTFTTGVNLPFIVRNIPGDQLFTLVTSRYDKSLANPKEFMQAVLAATKHNELWHEMVKEGAGFTSFDLFRNQAQLSIKKIRAGKNADARTRYISEHPVASMGDLFRAVEDVVSRSEEFGRARLYAQAKAAALKAGRTEADARINAAREANNALPNYYRSGSMIRPLNTVIPYLNASIQGTRSFLAAMQKNPIQTSARVAVSLYFPVAAATLWNLSDPERKKAYEDVQEYEKDNNIIFLLGSGQDKQNRYSAIKIKLPPGVNYLTVPIRRFLEQAHGMDPVRTGELAKALVGTVSPVEPTANSVWSMVIPQAIKPAIQAGANKDFFRDRPKVPRSMENLPPEAQVFPYTSGTARKIAGPMNVSPIKVEEFVKDTLGGMAPQILNASDNVLAKAGVIPKDQIGGTSTVSAVFSALDKARGGDIENREWEAKKSAQDDAGKRAFAELDPEVKSELSRLRIGIGTPQLKEGADPEKYADAVVRRSTLINKRVARIIESGRYQALDDERKTKVLRSIVQSAQVKQLVRRPPAARAGWYQR